MGMGAQKIRLLRREGPPRLDDVLQQTARQLISSPHHAMTTAIESGLAGMGDALGADRIVAVTRESDGFGEHYVWERKGRNGTTRRAAEDALDPLLGRLDPGSTLAYSNRKSFPAAV